jgi:gas vesicle protein
VPTLESHHQKKIRVREANMRHKEFWIALSFGALAGAVAALLYAPQSGTATRKKIRRGVEDWNDNLKDSADYLKSQAEKLSKEAQKLIDFSKDQFETVVDQASGVVKTANKTMKTVSKLV